MATAPRKEIFVRHRASTRPNRMSLAISHHLAASCQNLREIQRAARRRSPASGLAPVCMRRKAGVARCRRRLPGPPRRRRFDPRPRAEGCLRRRPSPRRPNSRPLARCIVPMAIRSPPDRRRRRQFGGDLAAGLLNRGPRTGRKSATLRTNTPISCGADALRRGPPVIAAPRRRLVSAPVLRMIRSAPDR